MSRSALPNLPNTCNNKNYFVGLIITSSITGAILVHCTFYNRSNYYSNKNILKSKTTPYIHNNKL